jgi:hypothetical protein
VPSIITDHPDGALSVWPSPGERDAQLAERHALLQALDPEQLPLALEFLIGYNPRIFDALLEAVDPCPPDGYQPQEADLEPFCQLYGASLGEFLAHGPGYRHYRGVVTATSKPRPYKAGHKPIVGWRPAADTLPGRAAI